MSNYTLESALSALKEASNQKMYDQNIRHGAGENQFGVRMGDIRKIAKLIKKDDKLAIELWETGNVDAQFLAILIMKPKNHSKEQLEKMVRSTSFVNVSDWLSNYIINKHPKKEEMRLGWENYDHPMVGRTYWYLTNERVTKNPEGLDIKSLLDRIESEMGSAPTETQWTMNFTLAGIGIGFPEYRDTAKSIGAKLGLYSDYPTAKGCTSPYAPTWIDEMVSRQK